jgi:Domain of unknown function (DUF4062)/inactive STAND
MRVFISYTAEDLRAFADVVQDVLRRMEWVAIDHRDWAPDGRPSVATCRGKIDSCDIVVVLVAHRYGWVPPKEQDGDDFTSITWMEYKWARERDKPVVPFVVADNANWPESLREIGQNPEIGPRLDAFKAELRKGTAAFFTADHDSVLEKLQSGLLAAAREVGGSASSRAAELISASARNGKSVPPAKLPYRCDRIPQASLLRSAVMKHVKSKAGRPLICLVHGKSDEAHRPFVERVEEETSWGAAGSQCSFVYLSQTQPSATESFAPQIRANLAGKLLLYDCEDDEGIVDGLKRRKMPQWVFCVLELRASECGTRAAEVLATIHKYWQEFPELSPRLLIVCIVCFRFDDIETGLLGRALRWLRGNPDTNLAKEAIAALEKSGRDDARAPMYVLPPLRSVTLGDIDRWIAEARDWLASHITEAHAKAVLGGRESAPMDRVITSLQGWIRKS